MFVCMDRGVINRPILLLNRPNLDEKHGNHDEYGWILLVANLIMEK